MLLMRTTEDPADSVGELISSKQSLGLDHLSLAVHPLRFYGVKPRTLLGQEAHHDAYSTAAVFDLLVVSCNPTTHELALMTVRSVSMTVRSVSLSVRAPILRMTCRSLGQKQGVEGHLV